MDALCLEMVTPSDLRPNKWEFEGKVIQKRSYVICLRSQNARPTRHAFKGRAFIDQAIGVNLMCEESSFYSSMFPMAQFDRSGAAVIE